MGGTRSVTFRTGLGRAVSASVVTIRPSASLTGAPEKGFQSVRPLGGLSIFSVGGA
jgi:hypothetical protein